MTFKDSEQHTHRNIFIQECRQKAWSAACHADWISKGLDKVLGEYGKLKAEDDRLAIDVKALEAAIDSHTKDNRDKRKSLQERRNALVSVQNQLAENTRQGQQALNGLYQSIEASLALAKHAETWSWQEVEAKAEKA
jgi:hypothetical protein